MTTEEKAKAYDMALEAARKELGVDRKEWEVVDKVLKSIFPELKESEDERIRKEIVSIVQSYRDCCISEGTHRFDDCLAWLEKQKDFQAKVEQRMEYLWDKLPDAHRVEESNCTPEEWKALGAYMELEMNFDRGSEEKQKEQKPEWSEEDEHRSRYYGDESKSDL